MIRVMKKYFTVIFTITILMSAFHHHSDLKVHNDCSICVIQSNFTSADTLTQITYLIDIDTFSFIVVGKLPNLHLKNIDNTSKARAPPNFS
jgi:hypothetical protein